jgi:penicillin amidase
MITAFRWLLRLFSALIVLGLLGLAIGYYFLSGSIPDYDDQVQVDGVSAPVEIVRNVNNVPHIFGKTDEDVFFALGFAHAEDRLFQMVLMRRTVQGRLSEVFGNQTVKTDELMRRLNLYGMALDSVAAQDSQTLAALEAYARGVNARITQVNEQALGRGAPEFFFFSSDIAAWQPADSIALIKLLALQLSPQMQNEVLRAQMSMLLPADRLADILPDDPGSAVLALPDYASLMAPGLPGPDKVQISARDPLFPVPPRDLAGASNAWVAAPSRSAAGGSLLANDPHLAFAAPTPWYLARLELSSGGVIGGTIPGIPLILAGRSDQLGWGLTASYMDDQDILMEEVNPANPEEYRGPSGWEPFTTDRSIIVVKDADPLTVTLRWSANGPILPGSHFDLASVTPQGHVAALSWTALQADDTSMTAGMRLMASRSVAEAQAAGEMFKAPGLNLLLADRQGIALQMVGSMPARQATHETQGRMPALGWKAENRWQGYLPYAENPVEVNPESGIIGNTNNKTVDRPFPNHVSFDWGDTQRIQRWLGLMKAREVHTRGSFIEAQLDTVSFAARNLLALVGADLWFTGEAAVDGTPERKRQDALALLAEWNGEMNEHLPEPLIYSAWMRALNDRLIRDEIGPMADQFTHPDPVFIERVFRNTDGAGVWCDVIQSSPVET